MWARLGDGVKTAAWTQEVWPKVNDRQISVYVRLIGASQPSANEKESTLQTGAQGATSSLNLLTPLLWTLMACALLWGPPVTDEQGGWLTFLGHPKYSGWTANAETHNWTRCRASVLKEAA